METSSSTQSLESPAVFRQNPRGRNLSVVAERQATPSQSPSPSPSTKAKEAELAAAMGAVKVLAATLGGRALVVLTALGALAAFGWCLYTPSGLALACACLYAILVFLPALYADWLAR